MSAVVFHFNVLYTMQYLRKRTVRLITELVFILMTLSKTFFSFTHGIANFSTTCLLIPNMAKFYDVWQLGFRSRDIRMYILVTRHNKVLEVLRIFVLGTSVR